MPVSDGSISLSFQNWNISKSFKACHCYTEVGSKEEGIIIHPNKWIEIVESEVQGRHLEKVIAETREAELSGLQINGKATLFYHHKIIFKSFTERMIWKLRTKEVKPISSKLLGANVNLGNIALTEVITQLSITYWIEG